MAVNKSKRPSMRFWLLVLLYGVIQVYLADDAVRAFALSKTTWPPAVLWAILITYSPMLLWRLEQNRDLRVPAIILSWLVFSWMGFSFLCFWLAVAADLYGGIAPMAGLPVPAERMAFLMVLAATTLLWLYGFFVARHPRVERLTIRSGKLPADFPGLRIVQISDVHLGIMMGHKKLERLLKVVTSLDPDILVSTGDLVDAQAHYLNGLASLMASCRSCGGRFAVTGNHERFIGLGHALAFHERAGFRVLRGETVEVADGAVILAGVDDPTVLGHPSDDAGLLAEIPDDRFVLLLKHQPIIDPNARFDLQLSGHTHKGQIFPFNLLVRLVYSKVAGLYSLPNGGELYVSRGSGTWGPPLRILSPPEVTLISLEKA